MRLGRQGGAAKPWSTPWCVTPRPLSGVLDGEALPTGAMGAAELLALVAGQDTQEGDDGVFRIVQGCGQGPGHLDRRPRGPPRPQVAQPPLRRLQDPSLHRPAVLGLGHVGGRWKPRSAVEAQGALSDVLMSGGFLAISAAERVVPVRCSCSRTRRVLPNSALRHNNRQKRSDPRPWEPLISGPS